MSSKEGFSESPRKVDYEAEFSDPNTRLGSLSKQVIDSIYKMNSSEHAARSEEEVEEAKASIVRCFNETRNHEERVELYINAYKHSSWELNDYTELGLTTEDYANVLERFGSGGGDLDFMYHAPEFSELPDLEKRIDRIFERALERHRPVLHLEHLLKRSDVSTDIQMSEGADSQRESGLIEGVTPEKVGEWLLLNIQLGYPGPEYNDGMKSFKKLAEAASLDFGALAKFAEEQGNTFVAEQLNNR